MTIDYVPCIRVADLDKPHSNSVKGACSKCGVEVWVSSVTIAERVEAPLICKICLGAEAAARTDRSAAVATSGLFDLFSNDAEQHSPF